MGMTKVCELCGKIRSTYVTGKVIVNNAVFEICNDCATKETNFPIIDCRGNKNSYVVLKMNRYITTLLK